MVLSKIGSKNFVVNLMADYIMNKIGIDNKTKIQVIDCENFFVVKGKTESKDVINLSEIISEFCQKYSDKLGDRKISHTIDLIEYDTKLDTGKKISFTFHNTENCLYHYKQIEEYGKGESSVDFDYVVKIISDEEFCYTSCFPYGYSLKQGRLLFYYLKKMFYSIPSNYIFTTLTIDIDLNKTDDDRLNIFDNFSQSNDEVLKSAFLDHLDFNLSKVETEIKKVDCSLELINPLEEYSFLNEDRFDIIII